jgi:hypothetical protein
MNYGAAIADQLHEQRSRFDAYLIISSIDIEMLRPTTKTSSERIDKLLRALPELSSFSNAFDKNGLAGLRALALDSASEPQSVWWCETRDEFEHEIDGIYDRLSKSRKPYDAYDYGVIGTVAWVLLWRDR